jgi:Flp pilus assembly pilin Flp
LVVAPELPKRKGALQIQGRLPFHSAPERASEMILQKQIEWFLADEQGSELAEYAVAVALLVAVGLVVYNTLGTAINDSQDGTAAKVTEASTKTFPF